MSRARGELLILKDGRYAVEAPYNPAQLDALRKLPGARWDGNLKVRIVSSRDVDLAPLLSAVTELGFGIAPAILERAKAVEVTHAAKVAETCVDDPRLYPYQRSGIAWLAPRKCALIGDEMGLGKTIQILMALPKGARAIIIVPASLKYIWRDEVQGTALKKGWRTDLTPTVLQGRDSFRYPKTGEIVITNYDILADEPGAAPEGVVVVADEVQATKGKKTKRTKRFQTLVSAVLASNGRVWGSTGTPLMNRPPELFQILDNLNLVEDSFTHFGRFFFMFNATRTAYGTDWGMPKPEVPSLLGRVMLRRTRSEVLPEIPEKTRSIVKVNGLDSKVKALADKALQAWQEAGDPETLPAFEQMSAAKEALARAKIPALVEMVEQYEESEEPVVVFSDHLEPVRTIGEREGWAMITGDVPSSKRAEIVADFQAGKLKGVAITIMAGKEGLTLTHAHNMIYNDYNWVPANVLQSEDRICRIGQKNACHYTVLVAEHALEERIHAIIHRKLALISATVKTTAELDTGTKVAPVAEIEKKQQDLAAQYAAEAKEKMAELEKEGELRRCSCGRMVRVRVSQSAKNPNRKYFKCLTCDNFVWADEKPLSDKAKAWVKSALRYLASHCDGAIHRDAVGFNGADTGWGRGMAQSDTPLADTQARWVYRQLIKYQGQLSCGNLWPIPADVEAELKAS